MSEATVYYSFIGILFLAIVGCYGLVIVQMRDTAKQLSNIYTLINNHIATSKIHADKAEFVEKSVCTQINESRQEAALEMKNDLKAISKTLQEVRDIVISQKNKRQ